MTALRVGTARHRWLVTAICLVGMTLLAAGVFVGVKVWEQTGVLSERISATGDLQDANVRTLSQAQRELLKLMIHLDGSTIGSDEPLRLHIALVSQRVQESALGYQVKTLGSQELLDVARAAEVTWHDTVLPQVRAAAGTPGGSPERIAAMQAVADLEGTYNQLAASGEINRRLNADAADLASRSLLDGAHELLVWLAVLFSTGAAAVVIAGALFWRINRARAAAVQHLSATNAALARYGLIVHASHAMLLTTDAEGTVDWVNESFSEHTGWQADQLGTVSLARMLGGAADERGDATTEGPVSPRDVVRRAIAERERCTVEAVAHRRDGSPFWASIDFSPVEDAEGGQGGFFAVVADITTRKQAEHLLNRARVSAEETAAQKGRFLATMSHEIRTPLNSMLGFTELLLTTPLDPEQMEYAETANRSGKHLLGLINDILDYSMLEESAVTYLCEPVDVRGLVRDVVDMFAVQAATQDIGLVVAVDDSVPTTVLGDPMRLRQLLVNLVGNAVKFTESGTVTTTVTREATSEEHQSDALARLCFTVTDTGIGIPANRVDQVFTSFVRADNSTTRARGGTGLGLAICRQLVTAMGGEIAISSVLGAGTVVGFDVLLHTDPAGSDVVGSTASGAEAAPEVPDFSDLRVLVAEDDPVNRRVVTRMLARFQVVPELVVDGAAAVEAIRGGEFDVVLMDVEMPVMDGLRAVTLVREDRALPQPHVIAVTANALPGDRERFLAAGMDDYVDKPLSLAALRDALQRARDARRRPVLPAGA